MSLQLKFVILLGAITVVVAVSLGAALRFSGALETNLARPYRATVDELALLAELRSAMRDAGDARLERLTRVIDLLAQDDFATRLGPAPSRSLANRIDAIIERPDDAGAAHTLIALIDRTEGERLRAAGHHHGFGQRLSRSYNTILVIGLLLSFLTWALAAMLTRRWLVQPMLTLHEATDRFAGGDLDHRVADLGRDEIGALGRKLNDMAATISRMQHEAVERERLAAMGEMSRRLAHNIRNPLAGIRGMAELTLRRLARGREVDEQQREIIDAVDRFDHWLTELLTVSTPAQVRQARHDPRAWIDRVVQGLRPLAHSRAITLSIDARNAPDSATFDDRMLEHAAVAVLTNAIEVAPDESTVRIRLDADDHHWSIAVSDEGPGIPADMRERVFDLYFTTKSNGNGIGLAAAIEIAHRHGGTINLDPDSGRGATVRIVLPRMTEEMSP